MKTLIALAAAALMAAAPAKAQDAAASWPKHDVAVVVPFSAGGNTDMFARFFTNDLQTRYGKPFVVDNKTGAGGTVGAAFAANGDKNGYMLLVGTAATQAIAPFVFKNLRYDPAKDFQAVGLFAKVPGLLVVSNTLPIKTVKELIDYAKAHPGELNFGSSGIGSAPHLSAELFQTMAGVKLNHVPFKSSNEVMTAIVGGHIDLAFDNITSALPQAKSGTMRALAVTGPARSAAAADVPAMSETLPGYDLVSWHGLFVPTGTPKPLIDRLAADLKRVLAQPTVEAKFKEIGAEPAAMTPDETTAFVDGERAKYRDLVAKAGVAPQ